MPGVCWVSRRKCRRKGGRIDDAEVWWATAKPQPLTCSPMTKQARSHMTNGLSSCCCRVRQPPRRRTMFLSLDSCLFQPFSSDCVQTLPAYEKNTLPPPPPPVFSLLLTAHSSFTRPPLSPYHHRLGTDEAMSIVPTKPCQSSRAPLSQQDSSRQARSAARLARVLLGHGDSDGGEDDNSRTLLPCVVVELGRLPARAGRR